MHPVTIAPFQVQQIIQELQISCVVIYDLRLGEGLLEQHGTTTCSHRHEEVSTLRKFIPYVWVSCHPSNKSISLHLQFFFLPSVLCAPVVFKNIHYHWIGLRKILRKTPKKCAGESSESHSIDMITICGVMSSMNPRKNVCHPFTIHFPLCVVVKPHIKGYPQIIQVMDDQTILLKQPWCLGSLRWL